MHFDCRHVDHSSFDSALMQLPARGRSRCDTGQGIRKPSTTNTYVAKWFKAVRQGRSGPAGVAWRRLDAHRFMAATTIFEHFCCWEPNRRCSFYRHRQDAAAGPRSGARTFAGANGARQDPLHLSRGLDPRLPLAAGGPLSHMYFDSMFKSACEHLQSYVREVEPIATAGPTSRPRSARERRAARRCATTCEQIVAAGPRGAVALAGLSVAMLLAIWLAFFVFVFLPRGAVG